MKISIYDVHPNLQIMSSKHTDNFMAQDTQSNMFLGALHTFIFMPHDGLSLPQSTLASGFTAQDPFLADLSFTG